MPGKFDVRVAVDRFFASEKQLVGVPEWQPDGPHGRKRIIFPIMVNGEISGFELQVKAYPNHDGCRFRILIAMNERIFGLDFVDELEHINPLDTPTGAPAGEIHGPHYHSWIDNRHLGAYNSLPKKMKVARPLSARIRRFEQAFRWFCDEARLRFEEHQLPVLPERERLL